MKHVALYAAIFIENRRRLAGLLHPNSLAVLNANDVLPTNADGTLAFHQNADLFYLTGVRQEETVLLLAPDAADPKTREVLFVRQPSEHLATWEGHELDEGGGFQSLGHLTGSLAERTPGHAARADVQVRAGLPQRQRTSPRLCAGSDPRCPLLR